MTPDDELASMQTDTLSTIDRRSMLTSVTAGLARSGQPDTMAAWRALSANHQLDDFVLVGFRDIALAVLSAASRHVKAHLS